MITDDDTIQKLAFRSPLPRLQKDGFYLFAQLETAEQKLAGTARAALIAPAYAAVIAREDSRSERPLPIVLPRAYRSRLLDASWIELEYACDLAAPFGRRREGENVVGHACYLQGRVRLYRKTFAYFAMDDLHAAESPETGDGWIVLA